MEVAKCGSNLSPQREADGHARLPGHPASLLKATLTQSTSPLCRALKQRYPNQKKPAAPAPGFLPGSQPGMNPAAAGSLLLGTQKAITGRSSSFRALCAEGMAAYTSNVLTNSPTMPSGPLRSVNGITLAQPPLACLNFSLSRRENRTLVSKTLALKRTPVTD